MKSSPDTVVPLVAFLFSAITLVVLAKVLKNNYEKYLNVPKVPLKFLTSIDLQRPKLYWFCDAEINSRHWADFGARNTKEPNRGYLEIALNRVRETQPEFEVIPLIGRNAVYTYVPNLEPSAKQLPKKLWREFVIANILNSRGGLVMDGESTLCIGPSFYPLVKDVKAATFGIDPYEPVASPLTALIPGPAPYVGWSKMPSHPAWSHAANFYNNLVRRGVQAWSSASARRANQKIWETQKTLGCEVIRGADGGRFPNGKLRQLEDIFGNKLDALVDILPETVYIPYDGDDLERRYEFNWFLRLSPDQIMESTIVWSKLARRT